SDTCYLPMKQRNRKRSVMSQNTCRHIPLTIFLNSISNTILVDVANMKMSGKMFDLLYRVLCLVGLSFQLYEVLKLYLEYNTVSDIEISVPVKLTPPDVSICIRYVDIVDYNLLFQEKGKYIR